MERIRTSADPDPLEVLQVAAAFSRYFGAAQKEAISFARSAGLSWEQIAESLGQSRQALWQRASRDASLQALLAASGKRRWRQSSVIPSPGTEKRKPSLPNLQADHGLYCALSWDTVGGSKLSTRTLLSTAVFVSRFRIHTGHKIGDRHESEHHRQAPGSIGRASDSSDPTLFLSVQIQSPVFPLRAGKRPGRAVWCNSGAQSMSNRICRRYDAPLGGTMLGRNPPGHPRSRCKGTEDRRQKSKKGGCHRCAAGWHLVAANGGSQITSTPWPDISVEDSLCLAGAK
jgi:hypothetical protein